MEKTYRIAPLKWSLLPWGEWRAGCIRGVYSVSRHEWYLGERYNAEFYLPCSSVKDGKAQAEAHWREYIEQALIPVSE